MDNGKESDTLMELTAAGTVRVFHPIPFSSHTTWLTIARTKIQQILIFIPIFIEEIPLSVLMGCGSHGFRRVLDLLCRNAGIDARL